LRANGWDQPWWIVVSASSASVGWALGRRLDVGSRGPLDWTLAMAAAGALSAAGPGALLARLRAACA
ncbi:MAG TPA: hypothetical protein VGW38_19990, partial [Chloroflexota bacterium]|nr:hypothetical protein [Chloroflexota bacterium]